MKSSKGTSITTKQHYCKFCGNAIDHLTRKCTGCGKQYFRPHIAKTILLWSTILCLFAMLWFSHMQISQQKQQIYHLSQQISSLESDLATAKIEYNNINDQYKRKFSEAYDLAKDFEDLRKTYAVCENEIVVVNSIDECRLYHKCECTWAQLSAGTKKVYLKQTAISMGYKACSCIEKPYFE